MDYVDVHDFCSVSALVIGAPGSEWILLPKRAAAFREGNKKSSSLFQEICWEEPEKQKTRSCRAQELSRSCAQCRGRKRKQCTERIPKIGEREPETQGKKVTWKIWVNGQENDVSRKCPRTTASRWKPHPFNSLRLASWLER